MKRINAARFLCALAVMLTLNGCALSIKTNPVSLVPPAPETVPRQIRLQQTATVTLDTAYTRNIPANSVWRYAGNVPQGDVFRPVKTIFTIEGRQVHEAYLVISGTRLVGFYLPGEFNYSALSTPVILAIGNVTNE